MSARLPKALIFVAQSTIFLALVLIALAAVPLVLKGVENVYQAFPTSPTDRYKTFAGISGTLVAIIGVAAGLLTFFLNARANRRAQRKQHTITILLDSRLSDTFQKTNELRKQHYPPGKDIEPDAFYQSYKSAYNTDDSQPCPRRGAEALVALLNYYEFLSAGILEGDLDETMLRKTLRGIMCRLVDDSRKVIHEERQKNAKTFEHLSRLYELWRDEQATGSDGVQNERRIGVD